MAVDVKQINNSSNKWMNLVKFPGQYLGYCCGRKKRTVPYLRSALHGKAKQASLLCPSHI